MNFYEQIFSRGRATGEGMTHFERLFAAKFGGSPPPEVREYTGAVPVTITADGTPLIDLLISGNEEHTGTPTPGNQVMPNGTGERTGNLFDDFDIVGQVPSVTNGELVNSISGGTTSFIPLSNPLVSLTLFSSTMQTYLFLYDENKTFIGQATLTSVGTVRSSVITGYANAKYARIRSDKISLYDKNVTLVYGSTAPSEYIPYGYKIPILSANTTTNIYLGEVQSTRKVKKLVLTGEETSWNESAVEIYRLTLDGYMRENSNIPLCTHYIGVTPVSAAGDVGNLRIAFLISTSGNNYMYIRDSSYSTVSAFKTYLAAQYAAGTPVTVWYVLATEETAVVNEPLMRIGDYADTLSYAQAGVSIPTNNGSTTVDVDTELKPSEVYIKYMG